MVFVFLAGVIATKDGLAIGLRDSPVYLSSAENLAAGNGFVMSFGDPGRPIDFGSSVSPVTDFPIGYPAALGALIALGSESVAAARWIGIVALTLIAGLVTASALWRGISGIWSMVAGLTAATLSFSYVLFPLSELLYGVFLVIALICLERFIRDSGFKWFAVAVLAGSVSFLVRTIGVALVGTVVLIGLIAGGNKRDRLLRTAVAALFSLLPVAILVGGGGSRTLMLHPPNLTDLKVLANTVAEWLFPPLSSATVRVAVVGIAVAVAAWSIFRSEPVVGPPTPNRSWWPGGTSAAMHLFALLASRTLFDAQNFPGSRLMYPVALSLLMAGVQGYPQPDGQERLKRARAILAASCVAALVAATWSGFAIVQKLSVRPTLFSSNDFQGSAAVDLAVNSPTQVFSNVPDGLWYVGRPGVLPVPDEVSHLTTKPNSNLDAEMTQLSEAIENGAIIFYQRGSRPYLVDEEELTTLAPCILIDDGRNLVMASPSHPRCPDG